MLLIPNEKYINFIENSKHYLNDPKFMFNCDIDNLYRQGIVFSKEKAIEFIENFFNNYKYKGNAKKWVEWRETIDINEFGKLNKNSYIDKLPEHISQKHKKMCEWIERNTKYSF